MLNQKSHHVPRPQNAEKPLLSIGAMAFAQEVAAAFEKLETGYRDGVYNFIERALISYRKFLKDPDGYEELLDQEIISGLREKPDLKKTSRLVLYFLTNAQSGAERNTAGKYARIVDYLHKERVDNAAAADHVRELGGTDAVLKKARGHEVLKAADSTLQDDDLDFGQREEPNESLTLISASREVTDDLFDREKDLSIRVGPETLERVLGSEIGVGDSFYLECKKTGPADDGIRIVGTLVDLESA
jgi:hypothetical protein